MQQTIVGALAPVVLTMLLGVLAGWRGDEDAKAGKVLNTMVLVYALPLLLFAGTVTESRASLAAEMPLAAALFLGLLVPFVVAWLAARLLFRRDAAAAALEALSFGFPAIAFTGIPILTPLVGNHTTAVVAWGGIINNIVILPTVLVLLSLARAESGTSAIASITSAAKHALTQPVVVAPILAILLVLAGIKVPAEIVGAIKLLGGTVGGVSLFASGVILQAQKVAWSWPAFVCAVGRVLVVPLVAFATMTMLHTGAELRRMVVLALALAAAPMQVILAVRYRVHRQENATLLLISNVLGIPGLAFFIWLTG